MNAAEELIAATDALSELLEATGTYFYDDVTLKHWWLGPGGRAGNCEDCIENEDAGWIEESEPFPAASQYGVVVEPPLHDHCFPAGTLISSAGHIPGVSKRIYDGELIVLGIPGVDNFACTPNHPILTRRGWVAANQLQISDDVAQCLNPRSLVGILDPNNHQVESRIEDVTGAFLMRLGMPAGSVPVPSVALHDYLRIKAKINVMLAARSFASNYPVSLDGVQNSRFGKRHRLLRGFFAQSGSDELLFRLGTSSDRVVSRFGLSRPLNGGHSGRSHESGISRASSDQSDAFPSVNYGRSSDSRIDRKRKYAFSATMPTVKVSEIRTDARSPKDLRSQPHRPPTGKQGNIADLGNGRELLRRFSGQVNFVKVFEVGVRQFSGHVHNLQTRDGFYVANNILSHNCECEVEYKDTRKRVYV